MTLRESKEYHKVESSGKNIAIEVMKMQYLWQPA